MRITSIKRTVMLAGFAPAGKLSHGDSGLVPLWELLVGRIKMNIFERTGTLTIAALMCFSAAHLTYAQPYAPPYVQPSSSGVKFTILDNLTGTNDDDPYGSFVQGFDGNLYGTSYAASFNGAVFQVTPAGAVTTIYAFCETDCTDGGDPNPGLALDTEGNFYGTTEYGGPSTLSGPCQGFGCGTIFRLTSGGSLNTLYSFCSQPNCIDGDTTTSGVVRGADGNFYGTTPGQGANTGSICYGGSFGVGCGTVFKITPAGKFSTIYSFCAQANCADGATPYTGLVQAADGNLYGSTSLGGANGSGTIFKITFDGELTTVYAFTGYHGGCYTACGAMTQGPNGNLYGSTTGGGTNNAGTIFELTLGGTFTTLYNFCSLANCADGSSPSPLVRAANGSLAGGATYGAARAGTLFELNSSDSLNVLHIFDGFNGQYPGGAYPSGMIQATNGTFYGLAGGGLGGGGIVFTLQAGLAPFVETIPESGRVGSAVNILGTGLTGATDVTFNGIPAKFEVASDSLITASVPQGAVSGLVTVSTNRVLKSNARFLVTP